MLDQESGSGVQLEDVCTSDTGCFLYFTLAPVLYFCASLFICTGNSVTVVAVVKTRKLQTLPNMYIVSLACADVLSGVYVFNLAFLHLEVTHETLGHIKSFCLSLYVMFVISNLASSVNMVLIAVDRYIYIVHPYRYPWLITSTRTKQLIAGSWLVSAAVALSVIHFNQYDDVGECSFVHVLNYSYQVFTQTGVFFLTFVTVGALYTKIVAVALKQRNAIASVQSRTPPSWRHNIRTVRLMALLCGIYIACWMPAHIFICISIATNQFPNSLSFVFLLGILNSGVNFLIYPLMNKDFRRAIAVLLRCKKRSTVSTGVSDGCVTVVTH